ACHRGAAAGRAPRVRVARRGGVPPRRDRPSHRRGGRNAASAAASRAQVVDEGTWRCRMTMHLTLETLGDYTDDLLDDDMRFEADAHLAACGPCSESLGQL